MLGRRTGGPANGRTDVTPSALKGPTRRLATVISQTLRQFAGMPDYQRHIDHLRQCHPDQPIPSEREYFDEFLALRYREDPTRCC
jgi:uncharacterized short protein YbdD (DUF466 family)